MYEIVFENKEDAVIANEVIFGGSGRIVADEFGTYSAEMQEPKSLSDREDIAENFLFFETEYADNMASYVDDNLPHIRHDDYTSQRDLI